MSLGPVYVRGDDGKWYTNPVFGGCIDHVYSWFVCYDEDDPIELVIERGLARDINADWRWAAKMARRILEMIGWKPERIERRVVASRWFQAKQEPRFMSAMSFDLICVAAPLPTRFLISYDAVADDRPIGEGTYYVSSR